MRPKDVARPANAVRMVNVPVKTVNATRDAAMTAVNAEKVESVNAQKESANARAAAAVEIVSVLTAALRTRRRTAVVMDARLELTAHANHVRIVQPSVRTVTVVTVNVTTVTVPHVNAQPVVVIASPRVVVDHVTAHASPTAVANQVHVVVNRFSRPSNSYSLSLLSANAQVLKVHAVTIHAHVLRNPHVVPRKHHVVLINLDVEARNQDVDQDASAEPNKQNTHKYE